MRELRTSGSVGAAGEQSPAATRHRLDQRRLAAEGFGNPQSFRLQDHWSVRSAGWKGYGTPQ